MNTRLNNSLIGRVASGRCAMPSNPYRRRGVRAPCLNRADGTCGTSTRWPSWRSLSWSCLWATSFEQRWTMTRLPGAFIHRRRTRGGLASRLARRSAADTSIIVLPQHPGPPPGVAVRPERYRAATSITSTAIRRTTHLESARWGSRHEPASQAPALERGNKSGFLESSLNKRRWSAQLQVPMDGRAPRTFDTPALAHRIRGGEAHPPPGNAL